MNSRDRSIVEKWYAICSPNITRLCVAESLLERWLAFHNEPAGMTADIINDSAAFAAKMAETEAKQAALVAETLAALAKGKK